MHGCLLIPKGCSPHATAIAVQGPTSAQGSSIGSRIHTGDGAEECLTSAWVHPARSIGAELLWQAVACLSQCLSTCCNGMHSGRHPMYMGELAGCMYVYRYHSSWTYDTDTWQAMTADISTPSTGPSAEGILIGLCCAVSLLDLQCCCCTPHTRLLGCSNQANL